MRALVIGRGSMGARRIRDLKALGVEVESWDIKDGDEQGAGGLLGSSDAVVVSTPPMTKDYAELADSLGIPAFIEADVIMYEGEHYPSCTPRFNPQIVRVRERIQRKDIGESVAYTLHVGQHLADWHPGADLSSYYAAKRATGACREMVPFELGWLTWVFGPVVKAKALRGSLAGIADIDDVYQVVVEHQGSGTLGHLLIDAVSRPPMRRLNVVGTLGTLEQHIVFTEAAYLAEMRAFVDSIERGAPWPYSLAEEKHCLDVLASIEKFS